MHPLIPYFERPSIELPLMLPSGRPLSIHGFGILVAAGVILGGRLAIAKVRRDGFSGELLNRAITWIIVGIFVGGHLGHALLYEPAHYVKNPVELLYVWEGLSSMGGFFVTTLLLIWFFRKERAPPLPYGDALMVGLTLGWGLGRLGCFVAHDHIGTQTNFWLGVQGVCPGHEKTAMACHDLGLYEAIISLAVLLPLYLWLDRKPRFPGFFLALSCMIYGPLRLVMDVFRHPDTDTRYLGLTPAQYASVAMTLVGVWLWKTQRNRPPMAVRAGKAADVPPGAGEPGAAT